MLLIVGLLLVGVGAFWVSKTFGREDPEPWLEEARAELTQLVSEAGSHKSRTENATRAEDLLRRYLESNGTQRDTAQLCLASALLVLGETEEAERLFDRYNPEQTFADDLERGAIIAFRTGNFGLADLLIEEALSREEQREETLRSAIEIRYDLGRDEDVIDHVQELRVLAPTDPRPLLVLAYVYRDRGDWDHLVDAAREYVQLRPTDSTEARLMLIDALIRLGSAEEARIQFDILAAEAPGIAESLTLLKARLLNIEGQTDDALAIAEEILGKEPQNIEAMLLQGRILLAEAKFGDAVSTLEALARLDPANFEVHYLLGQAYSRSGQANVAQRELKLHQDLLNARKAIYRLERQAGRNPGDVAVRQELAKRYRELGVHPLADFWEQAAVSAETLSPKVEH